MVNFCSAMAARCRPRTNFLTEAISVLVALNFLLLTTHATAAYYKCTNANGETEFQSIPCPSAFENNETRSDDKPMYTVIIEGGPKFTKQVESCLQLLEDKAPEEFQFVRQHIGVIKQNGHSGMQPWAKPPRFLLSDKTAFRSLTWCASVIVHDAYHSYLYQRFKPEGNSYPVHQLYGDAASEKEANIYMIGAMKKIGSSARNIEYVRGLDGTHADTNKDGVIDGKDRVSW